MFPNAFLLNKIHSFFCTSIHDIFFIVVNEFCERFSYYGMRAVLVLYFKYFLKWDDDLATSIYHAFVALCYLTPILGAIVADSWLGKFKTIIYLSIVYAIGQIVMAVSAIHDITDTDRNGTPDNMVFHVALSMIGLFLIAVGTGGIKPCVSAFGGDQFDASQDKQRSTFFSVFYLCINAGSLLSTIITPILRAQDCGIHSSQKCYPLAFGVPAALMVVALVVFILGSGMYYKAEPQGNIMLDVCKCIGFAIKNRFKHRSKRYPKRQHWMDWAEGKYDKLLIAQIKMVLKVLFLYIPLPMFWTLFDQKGSRWTLQATTMDGNFGALVVQPDQMQVSTKNITVFMFTHLEQTSNSPTCWFYRPLKRMTVGMFLAAMAFVCAALVQIEIDKTLPTFPSGSESQLKLLNMGSNSLTVRLPGGPVELAAAQVCPLISIVNTAQKKKKKKKKKKSLKKNFCSLIIFNIPIMFLIFTLIFHRKRYYLYNRFSFFLLLFFFFSTIRTVFTIQDGVQSCEYTTEFGFGSSYTFLIQSSFTFGSDVKDIQPNSVHMALLIPQYFLITAGEVVFSVTGLEFSYSQAPSNMKAVLQAGWLFTVAIGNFIVLIVAEVAQIPEQWAEFVLFAALLVAVCVIFSIMAHFYTYIDPKEIEAQFQKKDDEDNKDFKDQHEKSDGCNYSFILVFYV
uniref:Solute carrier family 15 member 1 n=1 Tax=Myripristis murdjan TaxID=586833 RepID=A0A668A043_9TELE